MSEQPLSQVFVGGTGRSGTTIAGQILGEHGQIWFTSPPEMRFITDPKGLLDLVQGAGSRVEYGPAKYAAAGKTGRLWLRKTALVARESLKPAAKRRRVEDTNLDDFVERMLTHWWRWTGPDGHRRGFHRGLKRPEVETAVANFREAFSANPEAAARTLVSEMIDPAARRQGALTWVDTTPTNGENAARINRLLPDAKLIHMIRDGRDTVSSLMTRPWGPTQPMEGLEWWRQRVLRSHVAIGLCPPEQTLTMVMEDLVTFNRDPELKRLFNFLGYDPDESVLRYFSEQVNADQGHQGRWRKGFPADLLPKFERRYAEIHRELSDLGLPLPPL